MSHESKDIARQAFASEDWKSASDALFQATGIGIAVMDFGDCVLIAEGNQCGYCHLATDIQQPGPLTCFDSCPQHDAGPGRIICRAGLACLYAPVVHNDAIIAHLVVSGFVTSTRERNGLYERLLQRGVAEASARRAVKSLPVVARRQAESYLDMALANARTVVTATADRLSATDRIDELRLFVSAGHHVVATDRLDSGALGGIVEESIALVGGEAGAILRPRGNKLEVVARSEGWRGVLGTLVPRSSTAAGRAADTGRTVVAPGKDQGSTLAMPLVLNERLVGILEIRLPSSALPLSSDRVSRLGRFGQFIAVAIEREDERLAVDRAMVGYSQLNELTAALSGMTDVDAISDMISSVLERSFGANVCGVVLSGWGHDKAEICVRGKVPSSAPRSLLIEAVGRDIDAEPFASWDLHAQSGELVDAEEPDEWALAVASIRYRDLDVGTLFLARADGVRFCAQDNALLDGIAAHGGAAFSRAALFMRIRDDYAKTVAALSLTLDIGEHVPSGHAGRVMEYAMAIGQEMGLDFETVEELRFAGLLHDVGKSGISEEILLKPSRLTAAELEQVRRHAEIGASIVDQIEFLKAITPTILHHHERWDGKGYPQGLKGEEIPLLSRILYVADCFDAMTSERPYAKKMTIRQARLEMEKNTGTQYDPRVVAALFCVLDNMALSGSTGLLASPSARGNPELPA